MRSKRLKKHKIDFFSILCENETSDIRTSRCSGTPSNSKISFVKIYQRTLVGEGDKIDDMFCLRCLITKDRRHAASGYSELAWLNSGQDDYPNGRQ